MSRNDTNDVLECFIVDASEHALEVRLILPARSVEFHQD